MNFFRVQITHIAPVILVHTSEGLEFPFDHVLSEMWVIHNLDSRLQQNVFKKYYSRANDNDVQAKLHFFEREYMYGRLHCNEHLHIDWRTCQISIAFINIYRFCPIHVSDFAGIVQ